MLEHVTLVLCPWSSTPDGERHSRTRHVADGSGTTLGFVRQWPSRTPRWLRWLSRQILEVCESPDGSLVFAVRRGWGWPAAWHVFDADDRMVGTLRGQALLDGFGHFLAVIEAPDERGHARFLAADGRHLGGFAIENEDVRVSFSNDLDGNPFAKMLLLASVLAREA